MELDFYLEECCDQCHEIIHTHFICPVCKKECGTSKYGTFEWDFDEVPEFECEKCRTVFFLPISAIEEDKWMTPQYSDKWQIKINEEKK